MERKLSEKIINAFGDIKRRPFVPCITNFVTADFVINCMLAAGASPAVLNLPEECCASAAVADTFYINLGTILPVYTQSAPAAAEKMFSLHKGWVLDPVAAGLGKERTEILMALKEYKPSIVRANASEVITLAKLWGLREETATTRGVDSTAAVNEAREAAIAVAQFTGGAVAVSGEQDLITDGKITVVSHGGSFMMERITGCGCSLGGVAAFCLAFADPFTAALCAVNAFNVAGSEAASKSSAPASFKVCFIDSLYNMTAEKIAHNPFEVLH